MKKAYCGLPDFNIEAKQIIENAGIDLTVDTGNRPAGDKLIDILQKYDILIIGVFSKLTADMIKYVKTPKIIASFSVGLDHIDKSFFESPLVKIVNIKTANSLSVAEHIF